MTDDNVDVTKKGYDAFSAVDLEAALSAKRFLADGEVVMVLTVARPSRSA
jgi:hypothetical protein